MNASTYGWECSDEEELLELEDEAVLVLPLASGEATKLCLCSTRFNLGVAPLETILLSSLRSKYVPNFVQQAPIFSSCCVFFPLEIVAPGAAQSLFSGFPADTTRSLVHRHHSAQTDWLTHTHTREKLGGAASQHRLQSWWRSGLSSHRYVL